MVGPELLRHIWNENTPEANAPTDHSYNGTVHTGWRSNFSVPIQTDNWMIGVPRYADYAVKVSFLRSEVNFREKCEIPLVSIDAVPLLLWPAQSICWSRRLQCM